MNDRILKLAASHFPRDSEGNICATPEIITEFAELIVWECMDICEELGDKGLDSHYCVDKIKEHFGVE